MKTDLITRDGYNKLKEELDYLWREYRPEITKKVTWAASLGDRSENADYKENKRLLRQIDSRVRYLRKRLEVLKVVDYSPEQEGRVFFGAWVEIENEDGQKMSFKIVGPWKAYVFHSLSFQQSRHCVTTPSDVAHSPYYYSLFCWVSFSCFCTQQV